MTGVVVKPSEPIRLELKDGQSTAEAWDAYFASQKRDNPEQVTQLDAQIRATAKVLSEKESYFGHRDHVVRGHSQFAGAALDVRAAGLALMATDAPESDVERALMSAVDMTNSQDDAMNLAVYMARIGLDRRALQLFRELAYANPFRPEPYALGLRVRCGWTMSRDCGGRRWASWDRRGRRIRAAWRIARCGWPRRRSSGCGRRIVRPRLMRLSRRWRMCGSAT